MRNYFAIFRKIIIFALWYSAICWICSHTLRGCVDWNKMVGYVIILIGCHTLRGCVDWNQSSWTPPKPNRCHTLRGCVDWNTDAPTHVDGHNVTPFVGVWIETDCIAKLLVCIYVTPFVGVWIETEIERKLRKKVVVTPFVGVWIETSSLLSAIYRYRRHTLRGCVDWNTRLSPMRKEKTSHTLRGCVDWNQGRAWCPALDVCHTLRGCVDWNLHSKALHHHRKVTPFVGVWIET